MISDVVVHGFGPSGILTSVEELSRVQIQGLHHDAVSIVGVALDRSFAAPRGVRATTLVSASCPLLDGRDVAVRLELANGAFVVSVLSPADVDPSEADLRVRMDWCSLVGWLPDSSVMLGDLLHNAMALDGDIVTMSVIEGSRVVSGAALGSGVGALVAAVNRDLVARHVGLARRPRGADGSAR